MKKSPGGISNLGSMLLNNFSFGVFGVNKCNDTDNSWYCNFSRIFSSTIMIIVLIIIFVVIYLLIIPLIVSQFNLNSIGKKIKLKRG